MVFLCSLLLTWEFMMGLSPSHWFNLRCTTDPSDSQRSPGPVFATRCTAVSWSLLFPKGYMHLQRDYLNVTNKQHSVMRFLSRFCKPHSFRDLMKDNLIKNLLPFFRINQLINARACSEAWSIHSIISCYIARLVCGLAHTSAEFLSRFQGITWGGNHSQ